MYSRSKTNFTATADKYPQGYFKVKPCRLCSKEFQPVAPSHMYCSDECFSYSSTDIYLRKTYGIGYDTYLIMLSAQSSRCRICGGEGFRMKDKGVKLVVDHCHDTGKVRGLLCHNCNRALGLFHDNVDDLKAAINYLEGSTTIPEGSTPKWVEAPDPSAEGDDIV